ncbi:MAG TPA: sigma factor-like helix-turn-helix DNA-binding protein [Candidatus Paceibacterota bacterium]|nr:sigma factor-like helix-turn-helix DNA-binding protein [Candidatus Paceibacterota bacterium]
MAVKTTKSAGKSVDKKAASKRPTAKKPSKATKLGFDAGKLVKQLLEEVPDRAREVLTYRFGLGTSSERETLEAIGERWSITRERVRQIEAAGLETIRNSKSFKSAQAAFDELAEHITMLGGIVEEEELLSGLAADEKSRNRFRFLLVVGSAFFRERETDHFYARWHVDPATAEYVHEALSRLYASLSDSEVLAEGEMMDRFLEELRNVNDAYKNEEVMKRWLSLSKTIAANPLSEWGRAETPAIRTKGIRDYAYLVIKRAGQPMHFSDVAKAISSLFAKEAHVATTHNELIKDARFVLVGRGLYALSEWGYQPGVVRDVIRDVLKKNGALTREQVIDEVKKVRYVKDNTILVNLNDPKNFKRNKNGTYELA